MKKRKADPKKSLKRQDKKELQSSITQRFLDAVNNLGHDADRIAKDLKKIGKQLADKLSKIDKNKGTKPNKKKPVELLVAKAEEKGIKKKTGRVKAEKVVAKVISRKTGNGKAVAEKAQPVETPEEKAPATRGRRKTVSAVSAGDAADKPVSRRGRRPASATTATEAKPVVRRGPRKKVAAPDSEKTENSENTAANDSE